MKIENLAQKEIVNGYYYITTMYILAVILLLVIQKPVLIYEWKDILSELITKQEYLYLGEYSAFMPPCYPYYLYTFWKVFSNGFSTNTLWLSISIFAHSLLFCYAIYLLCIIILKDKAKTLGGLFCFGIILFFPPIFFGTVRNSSFALTTAIYILSFCYSYLYIKSKEFIYLFLFLLFGFLGLYTRWDFVAYFILMSMIIILNSSHKHKLIAYLFPFVVAFIMYLPWCYRNYIKMGIFTYNTSSAYNLAKGNNIAFDLSKMSNVPFDENIKKSLPTDTLGNMFADENKRDIYLKQLVKQYVLKHPSHFVKISLGKFLINLVQYFPESFNGNYEVIASSKAMIFTIFYSCFFIIYTFLLFLSIKKNSFKELINFKIENYFFQFVIIAIFFHFMINTFAAPPLPRYILFYFPFFTVYIFYTLIFDKKSSK